MSDLITGFNIIETHSASETENSGVEFIRKYKRNGLVVLLFGNLGAGKTQFVKGIAKGLGFEETVTSPTFGLVQEYTLSSPIDGIRTLYHLDCYRFEQPKEMAALGIEDYLYPRDAVTVIEWPDRIASLLPPDALRVEFVTRNETTRRITIGI